MLHKPVITKGLHRPSINKYSPALHENVRVINIIFDVVNII